MSYEHSHDMIKDAGRQVRLTWMMKEVCKYAGESNPRKKPTGMAICKLFNRSSDLLALGPLLHTFRISFRHCARFS